MSIKFALMSIENNAAINKEKAVSVPWDADGQNVRLGFRKKRKEGY